MFNLTNGCKASSCLKSPRKSPLSDSIFVWPRSLVKWPFSWSLSFGFHCRTQTWSKKHGDEPIRRPAGVSCGSCLFVVGLFFLSLSCLEFPLGADFCLVELEPTFCLDLSLCCGGLNSALGFAHLAVISMVVSVFLLCLPSVCSVVSYIQYLIHWLLCRTPFTRITFLNMAFSKPWFTHMLWFKLKLWFEQNQCFCVQTLFYTKSCFTQKLCYPQTSCFTQNNVLSGPVQGLFAAYRIALSMVAGGTRRRRLNMSVQIGKNVLMLH